MTMLSDEILFLTASELAKRIQSKALSPVDLTKAYLDRSEKIGPKLDAYARLTPEIAKPLTKKLNVATIAGRCTEFLTPQKICSPQEVCPRPGAQNRTKTRFLIMTPRSSNISAASARFSSARPR
jgi:hypothetical protein